MVKELEDVVKRINKKYGENTVIFGKDVSQLAEKSFDRKFISTGILQLDLDLGGGIPIGRYVEISGKESSTKSTLAIHIVAEAQKKGIACAYFDIEGTNDEHFFRACGANPENILYFRPSSLEETVNLIDDIQEEGTIKLAVYDSIAASMASELEQDKDIGESMRMGIPQQELQALLRRFQMKNNKYFRMGTIPFTLIGINQLRESPSKYGDPEYTPGGRAKDFMSSVNIRLRQGDYIKEGQSIVGQVVRYKISKNKVFKRMRSGEVNYYFDENNAGVTPLNYDTLRDTIIVALEFGIINKSGGWYQYQDEKVQGLENLVALISSKREYVDTIRKEAFEIAEKIRAGKQSF